MTMTIQVMVDLAPAKNSNPHHPAMTWAQQSTWKGSVTLPASYEKVEFLIYIFLLVILRFTYKIKSMLLKIISI